MQRNYFYRINEKGRIFHDDTEVDDERFLRNFYRYLQNNDGSEFPDFPFVSFCGKEKNYLKADDTPIVFQRLTAENTLEFAPETGIPFLPQHLRFSREGILYHASPLGAFGRISASLALDLAKNIEKWGNYFSFSEDHRVTVIEPLEGDAEKTLLRPRIEHECFGCGWANPAGLALTFLKDNATGEVRTWFKADKRQRGADGWMHGGLVSLVLDEIMGKVLSANGFGGAPTARLNISFRRPTRLGVPLMASAVLSEMSGRKHFLRAELRDISESDEGILLAEGEGLFIRPKGNF